jgi:hypothetical protein
MPTGSRIRANNVYGVTSDNPLSAASATFNSVSLPLLPVVAVAHAVIVFDPKRVYGDPEIVVVTAHTAASTVATVLRGQYGTSQRLHPQGTSWAHVPVNEDWTQILTSITRPADPYRGQTIFETDTNRYTGRSTADAWQQMGLFFDPPACKVFRSAVQLITNTTWTAITFDNESYDTDNMHSNTITPTRITVNTPGLYLLTANVLFAASATGNRLYGFRKNTLSPTDPTEGFNGGAGAAGNETGGTLSQIVKAVASDYFEVMVWQSSGGSLNTTNIDGSLTFTATWIGRGN